MRSAACESIGAYSFFSMKNGRLGVQKQRKLASHVRGQGSYGDVWLSSLLKCLFRLSCIVHAIVAKLTLLGRSLQLKMCAHIKSLFALLLGIFVWCRECPNKCLIWNIYN
jgi:hypothetical protein